MTSLKKLKLCRWFLIIIFLCLAFSQTIRTNSNPRVLASNWAGWDAINTIYYGLNQEDPINHFLEKAALELQDYLNQIARKPFYITNDYPDFPAIYLIVDPQFLIGYGEEAFRFIVDNNGISIIGNTPFATRSGSYKLLEKLGVYWLSKSDIFTEVPDSLLPLTAMDIIEEPDYIWREVEYGPNPLYGRNLSEEWKIRNLCGGPSMFGICHSYNQFMPASEYPNYPEAYLPEGNQPTEGSTTGWQLKPDNSDVINHAITWAENRAQTGNYGNTYTQEYTPSRVIPISPNDSSPWGTYEASGTQALTDMVFGLVNNVSIALHDTYPEYYIGCYSYSSYSEIPSFDMTYSNVYTEVATAYDDTMLTELERIEGFQNKGVMVGIREYYDITQWYQDGPPVDWWNKLNNIRKYYDAGARVMRAEGCESWGSAGPLYWIAARMCWDTSLNFTDLFEEWIDVAFGTASEPMKRYFTRWLYQRVTDNSLACATNDLFEAEMLAEGNQKILDRIKYFEYYVRYEYYYSRMDDMSLEELASFWSYATKLRDLYVLAFRYVDVDVFHDRLRDEWGMTEEEIETWMDNYADWDLPTAAEDAAWMSELQSFFSGIEHINGDYIDPTGLSLVSLNQSGYPTFNSIAGTYQKIYVLADAGDIINLELEAGTNFDDTFFYWYAPDGTLLDSVLVPHPKSWTQASFTASAGSGLYRIDGGNTYPYGGGIKLLSHPAGIPSGGRLRECDIYVYVPENTDGFLFEFEPETRNCVLYEPSGLVYDALYGTATGYEVLGANNPTPGLWHLHYQPDPNALVTYKLFGIPDLVWNDAERLLVSSADIPVNYVFDINLDGSINVLDVICVAQRFGENGLPGWISEDVNKDGSINVLDIIQIWQHVN